MEKLTLQKSEVEEVSFVELEKLIGQVREQSILSCIDLEELLMLKKALVTQDRRISACENRRIPGSPLFDSE